MVALFSEDVFGMNNRRRETKKKANQIIKREREERERVAASIRNNTSVHLFGFQLGD